MPGTPASRAPLSSSGSLGAQPGCWSLAGGTPFLWSPYSLGCCAFRGLFGAAELLLFRVLGLQELVHDLAHLDVAELHFSADVAAAGAHLLLQL